METTELQSGRKEAREKLLRRQAFRQTLLLNAVFVIATSAIIAPSVKADEHSTLSVAIFSGVFISVALRVPGVYFERYLSKRHRYKRMYITHLGAAVLALLVAFSAHYNSDTDAVASMVATYIFLSSIGLGLVIIASFVIALTRKAVLAAKGAISGGANAGHIGLSEVSEERPNVPPSKSEVSRSAASVERHVAPKAPSCVNKTDRSEPKEVFQDKLNVQPDDSRLATTPAAVVSPGRLPDNITAARHAGSVDSSETRSAVNRVALALGIVTGIASLVQGFNGREAYKTLTALAIGCLALAAVYLPAVMRRVRRNQYRSRRQV